MRRKTKIEIVIVVVMTIILIGYAFLFMESAEYYAPDTSHQDPEETKNYLGPDLPELDTPIEEFCANHCKMCHNATSCDLECFVENCTHLHTTAQ